MTDTKELIDFDNVLKEIEVDWDISEGNYDILRYYRNEYKDLLAEVKRLREELKQTRESLWWCYDNYRFDGHPMTDVDWNFIGNLLGADMESEEE